MSERPAAPAFDLARLGRFARKELREVLRDRRTILTLVLMPLLLYPLLAVGLRQLFLAGTATAGPVVYRIGFVSLSDEELFDTRVLPAALHAQELGENRGREISAEALASDGPKLFARQGGEEEIEHDLHEGLVHVVLRYRRVPPPQEVPPGVRAFPRYSWEVIYPEGSGIGAEVFRYLRRVFALANVTLLEQAFLPPGQQALPLTWEAKRVGPIPARGGGVVTTLIPLILVLMTITGAVYPAIDLTAGERERGTLELLMAAPVPRLWLLLGKFAAVLTVALLTALINLTMMTLTTLATGLGPTLFGPQGVTILLVVQVLALLFLFALFFSAVLLALTSFARSFKEAQAYLVPLMLLALAPGVATLLPDLSLHDRALSVTPLMNVVLLARDVFADKAEPELAFVVVASTLLYAALALALAARLFGAEAVLYADGGGWGDLLRRRAEPRAEASLSTALLCLALLFPAQFLLGGAIAQLKLPELTRALLLSALSVWLFVGVPLGAALLGRVRLFTGFRLGPPPLLGLVGGLLLGLSLWPFAALLVLLLGQLAPSPPDSALAEQVRHLVAGWREAGPGVTLLLMAVAPAVAEEWLFRGYLFTALRAATRPSTAVLVSALLFGVFHVLVGGQLSWERLLTSTLLGLVLGWVRWRTDSLWPGIVLHACHNGILVLAALAKDGGPLGTQATVEGLLPWLAAGAAGALIGSLLVAFCRSGKSWG